jgi:hypothetical protein
MNFLFHRIYLASSLHIIQKLNPIYSVPLITNVVKEFIWQNILYHFELSPASRHTYLSWFLIILLLFTLSKLKNQKTNVSKLELQNLQQIFVICFRRVLQWAIKSSSKFGSSDFYSSKLLPAINTLELSGRNCIIKKLIICKLPNS